jgi:hypothetical protein
MDIDMEMNMNSDLDRDMDTYRDTDPDTAREMDRDMNRDMGRDMDGNMDRDTDTINEVCMILTMSSKKSVNSCIDISIVQEITTKITRLGKSYFCRSWHRATNL